VIRVSIIVHMESIFLGVLVFRSNGGYRFSVLNIVYSSCVIARVYK